MLPLLWLLVLASLSLFGGDVQARIRGRVVHDKTRTDAVVKLAPGKKYAYVTIHYEGTPRDLDYIYGMRVLISSIKHSGTPHDIVVLCSTNVSPSTIALLEEDGAIVKVVPNIPNPFKTDVSKRGKYNPHFEFTMNKLLVWNMTEYERVIFMDEDNLVVYNIDELFMCGHFCVVFLNPLFFHTGLMVVKPDADKFHHLVNELNKPTAYSFDGADQGFLTLQFKELEAAPLFDAHKGIHEDPTNRISLGYNFNHVYYYPFFSWDAIHRRHPHFKDLKIPVMTIAYPIAQYLKPWNWWASIFFDLYHLWQAERGTLTHDYFDGFWVFTRIAMIILIYLASVPILHYVSSELSGLTALPRKLVLLLTLRWPFVSSLLFSAATICLSVILFISYAIPQLAPPMFGYPLFIIYHNVCVFLGLCWYALLLSVPFPRSTLRSLLLFYSPVTPSLPYFSMMLPSLLMYTVTWLMGFLHIYSSFVPKCIALFAGAAVSVLLQLCLFSQVAHSALAELKASRLKG